MSKEIELLYSREDILKALEDNNFYMSHAARHLEISRSRIYAYIRRYDIVFEPKMGAIPKHKINNDTVNNVYYKMLNRCNNPKAGDYKYYGGRGIKVCKEWEDNSFVYEEDLANKRYKQRTVIALQGKKAGRSTWDRLGSIEY